MEFKGKGNLREKLMGNLKGKREFKGKEILRKKREFEREKGILRGKEENLRKKASFFLGNSQVS